MMKRPPKDVGKALDAGYQPMFMTGPEIKENFAPFRGDKQIVKKPDTEDTSQNTHREETNSEMWNRKLTESKMTGAQRFGKEAFERVGNAWRTLSGPTLANRGIRPDTSLESVAKTKGIPGHVSLQAEPDWKTGKREVLGGHHRIALSAEQFKNHIFPVKYYDSISDATGDKGYM